MQGSSYFRFMLSDLNQDQLQLEELMSQISEEAYSAGWMIWLEYALWGILNGSKRNYGRHVVSEVELLQLKCLSDKCGCWIVFDDETEETAIDFESWKKKFNEKMRIVR